LVYRAVDGFDECNKGQPRRIIFFHDGLLEGEYEGVGKDEIEDIKGAIDDIWHDKKLDVGKLELTFIVIERHHVRFFPRSKDEADRSGNCHAGFIANTNGVSNPALLSVSGPVAV
ncbi:hypothetical protein K503DRAFT_805329, partial [Rhizopogon vinicolor AM-OR11-026]